MTEENRKFWESEFQHEEHRVCHQCREKFTVEQIIKGMEEKTVGVQMVTGRLFYFDKCWDEYLEGEGLK